MIARHEDEGRIEPTAAGPDAGERFEQKGSRISHSLNVGVSRIESCIDLASAASAASADLKGQWWRAYLAGTRPTATAPGACGRRLRAVDLFCGAGGLALGVAQLAAELGTRVVTELVVDSDAEATAVYAANHDTRIRCTESVSSLIDYRIRGRADDAEFVYPPEILDERFAEAVAGIDLVMAGPPCQGHSNLNNRTRRSDKRNTFYLTVPAFTLAAGADMAIIENVPEVERDDRQVVDTAQRLLEASGYSVVRGTLRADALGWPQTRRRSFLVARRDAPPIALEEVAGVLADNETRTLQWLIGDLVDIESDDLMDRTSELNPENRERVEWLLDNDAYDLPAPLRPPSHRAGTTYGAVYGRMRMNGPAPTITTGFMTPGRGRYVHPTRPRTLTPREAARIQGFPDVYRFVTDLRNPPARSKLAKWIGDAVPMPLGYAAALSALGPGLGLGAHSELTASG